MTISLDNRIALVGGATSGIGWAIASTLARVGARVILVARNRKRLEQCLEQLQSMTSQEHLFIAADYDDPAAAKLITAELERYHCIPDILINNVAGPAPGAIVDAEPALFHQALDRLILTTHQIIQYVLPTMKDQQWGRIINIISTSVRQPIEGLGVSNTMRAATAAWAKTLSIELAPYGITVNSILPGATRTERLNEIIVSRARQRGINPIDVESEMIREIPMRRFGDPLEIASLAVFLCSDYAAYITGECIRVDGGRTRCL